MKKKRRIANAVMAVILLLIAAAGLFAVGSVRGWFSDEKAALLTDVRGTVRLERSGVSYPVEEDTALREGDHLACDAGATCVIRLEDGSLTLGGNADVTVADPDADAISLQVSSGEIFADTDSSAKFAFEGIECRIEDCAALLSVRAGAQTLSVYAGSVQDASKGQKIDWVGGVKSIGTLTLTELDDFAITQIRAADEARQMCFTDDELDDLQAQRTAAMGESILSDGDGLSCTIAIYCDTILDNWGNLDTAKASYVPADGVILPTTQVSFESGETVFDVLKRVCEAYDIQLEYSWTPMYDSYYIEGIHQLYEFDCGSQSGWMYKVNEWFPNYGCSSYTLTGGEAIVWCYTCNGLGADVGGPTY